MKLVIELEDKPEVNINLLEGYFNMFLMDNSLTEGFETDVVFLADVIKNEINYLYRDGGISHFAEKSEWNTKWMREVSALLTKLADDVESMEE